MHVEFGMLWILAIKASALCMVIKMGRASFEINPQTTSHGPSNPRRRLEREASPKPVTANIFIVIERVP
jgi:hypothetical protein